MSDNEPDEPLQQLFEEAENQREVFNKARSRLQEVRGQLREMVDTLESNGTIDETEADRIHGLIDKGSYGEARDAIREASESEPLEFDDEEKDQFARKFGDSWREVSSAVEQVRTALLELDQNLDREDMVAYLYGKHSTLNKGDIRAVFDAIDKVEHTGLDTRQMARVLSAYNRDLNIEPTVTVLESIKADKEQ